MLYRRKRYEGLLYRYLMQAVDYNGRAPVHLLVQIGNDEVNNLKNGDVFSMDDETFKLKFVKVEG